jgi:hypothetical protein
MCEGCGVEQEDDIKMDMWLSDCELCRGLFLLPYTLRSLYLPSTSRDSSVGIVIVGPG